MTIIRFGDQGVGYVTVRGSPAVLKIDEGGHVLASWSAQQLWQPLLRSPLSVGVDRTGSVYVTDGGRVVRLSLSGQIFSASGKLLASWTGLGPKGSRFKALGGLTVDGQGNIFVLNGAELIELAPVVSL